MAGCLNGMRARLFFGPFFLYGINHPRECEKTDCTGCMNIDLPVKAPNLKNLNELELAKQSLIFQEGQLAILGHFELANLGLS